MTSPKRLAFSTSLILTLLVSGCALTDHKVALTYQPVLSETTRYSNPIVVRKFSDTRSNKRIVGEVRNLKGKKTADVVIENQDPSTWITDALKAELNASGFNVISNVDNPANADGNPVIISGTISELFITTNMDFMYRCTVRVNMQVMKNSISLLDKEYVGKGEAKAKWGFDEERESALRSSLQNLMERAIPGIIGALE